MGTKDDFAVKAKALIALPDENKYAAFLRERSVVGDHRFLLDMIKQSNLPRAYRKVIEEVITGTLRRASHRPRSDSTDMKNAYRALRVLDLEASGWNKRDAAIEKAMIEFRCSDSTLKKALAKYEAPLKAAEPHLLAHLRSAFKSGS